MTHLPDHLPEDFKMGSKDTHGLGIELILDVDKITPKQIWEEKDQWFEFAKESLAEWEKLMPKEQEALYRLVRSALGRMHDKTDQWVPECLKVEGGNYLDINIRILFTDVDREIEQNEQTNSLDEAYDAAHN